MYEVESTNTIIADLAHEALQRANDRANAGMWNINIVAFLFVVLILIIILITYTGIGVEVVGTVSVLGLATAWLAGMSRGRQRRRQFYNEELTSIKQELEKAVQEPEEEGIGSSWLSYPKE